MPCSYTQKQKWIWKECCWLEPQHSKEKGFLGSSNQQPLWKPSVCIVLGMRDWFTRLCFGLCVRHCIIFMCMSEFDLFVNVIFLKPGLVVLTHDFHSSNSGMIDRSLRKERRYHLQYHFLVREASSQRAIATTSQIYLWKSNVSFIRVLPWIILLI